MCDFLSVKTAMYKNRSVSKTSIKSQVSKCQEGKIDISPQTIENMQL